MRKGDSVLPAGIIPTLKGGKPVPDDFKQILVKRAVHSIRAIAWALLEHDSLRRGVAVRLVDADGVLMVATAGAFLVDADYGVELVGLLDLESSTSSGFVLSVSSMFMLLSLSGYSS